MTTPPEITDEHVTLLADLHAVITQAIADTPYVLGTPVGPFAAVITAEVAAYMGELKRRALAPVRDWVERTAEGPTT